MRVLIIEDDDLKFDLLARFLKVDANVDSLARCASYQAGIVRLVEESFDLVLLDMTLPVSDLALSPVGMEWLTFGGQLVLRESRRRKVLARIVIVSQYNVFVRGNEEISFEKLKEEIMHEYPELLAGFVHLDRASDNWRQEILNLIPK
jgi:CheY-like chemotaxis protein